MTTGEQFDWKGPNRAPFGNEFNDLMNAICDNFSYESLDDAMREAGLIRLEIVTGSRQMLTVANDLIKQYNRQELLRALINGLADQNEGFAFEMRKQYAKHYTDWYWQAEQLVQARARTFKCGKGEFVVEWLESTQQLKLIREEQSTGMQVRDEPGFTQAVILLAKEGEVLDWQADEAVKYLVFSTLDDALKTADTETMRALFEGLRISWDEEEDLTKRVELVLDRYSTPGRRMKLYIEMAGLELI